MPKKVIKFNVENSNPMLYDHKIMQKQKYNGFIWASQPNLIICWLKM